MIYIVYDVTFEGVTGNCFWFRWKSNRVRKLPKVQVISYSKRVDESQDIQVTKELFEGLQRAKLIDEHGVCVAG